MYYFTLVQLFGGCLLQENYLGYYLLTRLLEDILTVNWARVVNVSAVSHRDGELGPNAVTPSKFLSDEAHGNVYQARLIRRQLHR